MAYLAKRASTHMEENLDKGRERKYRIIVDSWRPIIMTFLNQLIDYVTNSGFRSFPEAIMLSVPDEMKNRSRSQLLRLRENMRANVIPILPSLKNSCFGFPLMLGRTPT